MPPRTAPGIGRGYRGGDTQRRGGHGPHGGAYDHLNVGVERPGYGQAGRRIKLLTNSFVADIPDVVIRRYHDIVPSKFPSKLKMVLIERLQLYVAPDIFEPQVVYDGRKNIYASHELRLGPTHSREFDVTMASNENGGADRLRPPKIYKVKVRKVAQINPQILRHYVNGRLSIGKGVLSTLAALNVIIRMDPNKKYPFNSRSFFTSRETRAIGGGIVLWRGYFQSVRPSIGRLLINVDISTGMMYRPGPLIDLCLDFFDRPNPNPNMLAGNNISDPERLRLQKFLAGMRVATSHTNGNCGPTQRVVKRLSTHGANQMFFEMNGDGRISVAQYFQQHANKPLRFPQLLCVELGTGALLPLELCTVLPGQIMRRQVPSNKTDEVVKFSAMKPVDRFRSIEAGRDVLAYGQSEYVRSFGLNIKAAEGLLPINARVLDPPTLKYGANSKQPSIKPRDGAWNMIDKKFRKPMTIQTWAIVIFEMQRDFPQDAADDLASGLISACRAVGMNVLEEDPVITYQDGQGDIANKLLTAGRQCCKKNGISPNLLVVVLPGDAYAGNDIYTAVKNFGDTRMGVATQCLKSNKCRCAKPQYWASVCLKINVKLGGINTIPDPHAGGFLVDPQHPTIVMGASVRHPVSGEESQVPSFTSLVGSVDGNCARYVATTRAQKAGAVLVADLKDMCKHILNLHISYRKGVENGGPPTRLIFYRSKFDPANIVNFSENLQKEGVSEGQFQRVLEHELPQIQAACTELKLDVKVTIVVVTKSRHVLFKCQNDRDADRSGNCPAGTVVDRNIGHPSKFDFYLQSHGGLIGTSKPTHYFVLHDDNKFDADSLQSLSFMLCHVYTRATRSVSMPAPVLYASMVCARVGNHYDLESNPSGTSTQTNTGTLQSLINAFRPLHKNQEKFMYFA